MSDKPTSLAWMPLYISETKALRSGLTTLQFGALIALRVHSWNEPVPGTLPDDDARLASISGLGMEWAENADVIREHFRPTNPDANGRPRLVDPEVRELWQEQWRKYVSASTRGGKGGRPKGGKQQGKQDENQIEKLGESSAFQQLQNALSSEVKTSSSHNTEQEKAGEKPSFSEPRGLEEVRAREAAWLATDEGRRWRQEHPDAKTLPMAVYLGERRVTTDRRQVTS